MEFEDNTKALFSEPNAYIQNYQKKEPAKKIIFSEPYENVPNFYLNNNFKKCEKEIKKEKPCNCHNSQNNGLLNKVGNFLGGFNLQNIMPILSMLNKCVGIDLSNIMSSLGGTTQSANPVTSVLSNPNLLTNVAKMFLGVNKSSNTNQSKTSKTTDINIKNYSRVE